MDLLESPLQNIQHITSGQSQGVVSSWEVDDRLGQPRVLVIDGNLLTAESMAFALAQLKFCARFVTPVTVGRLRELMMWKPEVALLDFDSVDSATSVDCITILREADVSVTIIGGKHDTITIGECVQAGASAVIDKTSPLDELIGTIMRLLNGSVLLTEEAKRNLIEPYQRETSIQRSRLAPFNILTQREKCVLAELMQGHCAEEIAKRSSVSIYTVRSQIRAILQKLGVNSQLAAAALSREAGWSLESPDGNAAPRTLSATSA